MLLVYMLYLVIKWGGLFVLLDWLFLCERFCILKVLWISILVSLVIWVCFVFIVDVDNWVILGVVMFKLFGIIIL